MVATMEQENQITIVVEGNEEKFSMADFGLRFDSTEREIREAMRPAIREKYGIDIEDEYEQSYKIKKLLNTRNILIYPNSVAGGIFPRG